MKRLLLLHIFFDKWNDVLYAVQNHVEEYAALVGRDLCFDTEKQFNAFMRTMPDVHPVKMPDGHFAWFSSSDKSKHIAQLVTNQKPSREFPVRKSIRKESKYNSGTTCFYNDNYAYKNRRYDRIDFYSSVEGQIDRK